MDKLMSILSFLDDSVTCNIIEDNAEANAQFVQIIKMAFNVVRALQILVPIALIIWGTLDFGKSVIEGDEKKIIEKRKPFVQRIISAIIVFFIPWIVGLVTNAVGSTEWKDCWNAARSAAGYTYTPSSSNDQNNSQSGTKKDNSSWNGTNELNDACYSACKGIGDYNIIKTCETACKQNYSSNCNNITDKNGAKTCYNQYAQGQASKYKSTK